MGIEEVVPEKMRGEGESEGGARIEGERRGDGSTLGFPLIPMSSFPCVYVTHPDGKVRDAAEMFTDSLSALNARRNVMITTCISQPSTRMYLRKLHRFLRRRDAR